MNRDTIVETFSEWPSPLEDDGHILVPTHCLYPSNSSVTVWIGHSFESYLVHDNHGAFDEVLSSGTGHRNSIMYLSFMVKKIVAGYGLSIDTSGLIKAERVSADELANAVVLVANASKGSP